MKRHKEELAKKVFVFRIFENIFIFSQASSPIKITLPDGAVQEGESWRTTPLMIADKISKGKLSASAFLSLSENRLTYPVQVWPSMPSSRKSTTKFGISIGRSRPTVNWPY
jgi:hypothetical protein